MCVLSGSNAEATYSNLGHQLKYSNFGSGLAVIKWHEGIWYGDADPRREEKDLSLQ